MHELRNRIWERTYCVGNEEAIRKFALAICDDNPLHHDNAAAVKAGFLGIIAPGVMLTGFVSSAIAGEIPGAMLCRLEMKFLKPLYAGTMPVVDCVVVEMRRQITKVEVQVRNMNEVLAKGSCILLLPTTMETIGIAA